MGGNKQINIYTLAIDMLTIGTASVTWLVEEQIIKEITSENHHVMLLGFFIDSQDKLANLHVTYIIW